VRYHLAASENIGLVKSKHWTGWSKSSIRAQERCSFHHENLPDGYQTMLGRWFTAVMSFPLDNGRRSLWPEPHERCGDTGFG